MPCSTQNITMQALPNDLLIVQQRDDGLFGFGSQQVGNNGIGMTVPHAVLRLEPSHHFHVLHAVALLEQIKPVLNGLTILFFDRRKIRRGSFGFVRGGHSQLHSMVLGSDGSVPRLAARLVAGRWASPYFRLSKHYI